MMFKRRNHVHHEVSLSEREKDESLSAAKSMFAKHKALNEKTNNVVTPKSLPGHRLMPVKSNMSKKLTQRPAPPPVMYNIKSATSKPQILVSSVAGGNHVPSKAHLLSQKVAKRNSLNKVEQGPSVVSANAAASLAHTNFTNMDTEWDLPINKVENMEDEENCKTVIAATGSRKPKVEPRNYKHKARQPSDSSSINLEIKPQLNKHTKTGVCDYINEGNSNTSHESLFSLTSSQAENDNTSYGKRIPLTIDTISISEVPQDKSMKFENSPTNLKRYDDLIFDNPLNNESLDLLLNSPNDQKEHQNLDVPFASSNSVISSNFDDLSANSVVSLDDEGLSMIKTLRSHKSFHSPTTISMGDIDTNEVIKETKMQQNDIVVPNASYNTVNKLTGGNAKYKGTLPNLIPNHTRQSKMDKFKKKFLSKANVDLKKLSLNHNNNNNNDKSSSSTGISSNISRNDEGRTVVSTNSNVKFKTTMRKHPETNFKDGKGHAHARESDDSTSEDEDFDDYESSQKDYSSINGNSSSKYKNRKRREILKERFKQTAALSPLHYSTHHSQSNSNMFNEDKPWKSHNDYDMITEDQKKRYEGMWVSNRYLYLELLPWWSYITDESMEESDPDYQTKISQIQPLPEDGLILNIVVKAIWNRSHLPNDLLVHIYNLVDTRKDGALDKRSFIVGMWLVDQCLYGRKLPKELDQQVWNSAERYILNPSQHSATRKAIFRQQKKLIKDEIKQIKKEMKNVQIQ